MIAIQRPGQAPLEIDFILIDFEGTLASDRRVHPKAKDKVNLLARRAKVHVLTIGEKAVAEEALKRVKADLFCAAAGESSGRKLELLRQLGPLRTAVIGNGVDDVPMMGEAGLALCVISKEGTSVEAMKKAHLVVSNVLDALDFLLKPLRQEATLGK
jgi:soluble P-type ATPase